MKKLASNIPFNYITIKITKSRIEKGLLAIPISLIDLFPKSASHVYLINDKENEEAKTFTSYKSSARECRIGGLKDFYFKNNIKDGDELVIQLLDNNKYRLIPEKHFEKQILDSENKFENTDNDNEAEEEIEKISIITNESKEEVLKNEFVRLAKQKISERKTKIISKSKSKENVPVSLRKILLGVYGGKCQLSNFSFLMKNGKPYFEIHHINPFKGNHLKNLLVVSPNIHAQFTYANVKQFFDKEGWLRKVRFNEKMYNVFQVIDNLPNSFEKKVYY